MTGLVVSEATICCQGGCPHEFALPRFSPPIPHCLSPFHTEATNKALVAVQYIYVSFFLDLF
jgi:hypothetical protein